MVESRSLERETKNNETGLAIRYAIRPGKRERGEMKRKRRVAATRDLCSYGLALTTTRVVGLDGISEDT